MTRRKRFFSARRHRVFLNFSAYCTLQVHEDPFINAAKEDLEITKFDVKTEFLYGELEEEIYLQPPDGYIEKNEVTVYKLQRSLYRLKQSPRCWNEKFVAFWV